MHAELTYRQKFYVFKQFGAPRDDIPQLRRVRKALRHNTGGREIERSGNRKVGGLSLVRELEVIKQEIKKTAQEGDR